MSAVANEAQLLSESEASHLAQLYAISQELLRLEDIEQSFPAIVSLIARAVPIRSAFLGLDNDHHARSLILEDPTDPPERREAARDHARDAYAYFTDRKHLLRDEEALVRSLHPREDGPRAVSRGSDGARLLLPLVVARRPVFGVLQLETEGRASESTLLLASAVANQLAVALDRHALIKSQLADADKRVAVDSARRVESEVRREEAETLRNRYVALIDGLEQAFLWECDARTFNLTYVSARAASFLGRAREDILTTDTSLVDLTVPADRHAVREALVWASTLGHAQRVDHRIQASDGRTLWLHTSVRLAERAGVRPRLQGVSFDVTSAKESETALRDQLEFTRAITSSLGEGVLVADAEGRITSANAAASTLLRIAPDALTGRRFRSVVELRQSDGTVIPAEDCPLVQAASDGASHAEDDVVFGCASGSFSASYTCTPFWRNNTLSGAVMVFRNVNALKRAEQTQRLFAELGATLGTTLDHQGAIADLLRFVARSFCDVAILETLADDGRVSHGEFYARPGSSSDSETLLGLTTPAERAGVLASRQATIVRVDDAAPDAPDSGRHGRLRDAGVRWFALVPLIARDRAIGTLSLYMLGDAPRSLSDDRDVLGEIARRASIAIDNARLYEEARRAGRARDDMLAVVSHDLRNPLGAIMLQTDLLLVQKDRTPPGPALESIRRGAFKMSRLIQDLLDVASLEAGRFSVDRQRVPVPVLLGDALETLFVIAQAKGVELECEGAPDLPDLSVDAGRFDQVMGNLVGNAIKFTPEGGTVRVTAEAAEGGVRFSVLDTGPGIAPEATPHVFDRFWQARQTVRVGTGLGLFICKGIIEAHGDTISVDSTLGVGSVFSFLLPLAEPDESGVPEEELREARRMFRARRLAELDELAQRRDSRLSFP